MLKFLALLFIPDTWVNGALVCVPVDKHEAEFEINRAFTKVIKKIVKVFTFSSIFLISMRFFLLNIESAI